MINTKNIINDAIKDLCDILRFKTVLDKYNPNCDHPFGLGNKKALDYMYQKAKNDGFKVKNVSNHALFIEYGEGNDLVAVLCHMDVVPASDSWDSNPFEPVIKDGRIYARGTMDDKGPLMASYYALKHLKDNNIILNKRVRLIIGFDEESGSRCLREYLKHEEEPTMGFSPDADFPLIYGEKGHANFRICGNLDCSLITSFQSGQRLNIVPPVASMTLSKDYSKEYIEFLNNNNYKGEYKDNTYIAYGISAHAMHPFRGLNASFILFSFLNTICDCNLVKYFDKYLLFDYYGKKYQIDHYDEELKELTLNLGFVEVNNLKFNLAFDLRVPDDNLFEKIKTNVLNSLKDFPSFEFLDYHTTNSLYVKKDSFLVKTLMNAYQKITNDYKSEPFTIGGGTYAKYLKNCVAFGALFPNREDVVHQDNEYIIIEDYEKMISIFTCAIYDLCK